MRSSVSVNGRIITGMACCSIRKRAKEIMYRMNQQQLTPIQQEQPMSFRFEGATQRSHDSQKE